MNLFLVSLELFLNPELLVTVQACVRLAMVSDMCPVKYKLVLVWHLTGIVNLLEL